MITALTNGFLGIGLGTGLSIYLLQWSLADALYAVLASNLASFTSVMITLHLGKVIPSFARLLKGILRTWACLFSCYYLFLFLLVPALREWRPFLVLAVPLALSTGFSIIIFGPIQDAIVRRAQRKCEAEALARRQESLSVTQNFSPPSPLTHAESLNEAHRYN